MKIVIVLLVVICILVANLNRIAINRAKHEKAAATNRVVALRSKAFQRLFKEEFPEFSNEITFARADATIECWESAKKSPEFKELLEFYDLDTMYFANERMAYEHLARVASTKISSSFAEYARKNSSCVQDRLRRAMEYSLTIAVG